jgi:hypothetical protein
MDGVKAVDKHSPFIVALLENLKNPETSFLCCVKSDKKSWRSRRKRSNPWLTLRRCIGPPAFVHVSDARRAASN